MKKSLLALSLGLAASFAGTQAFANPGLINFEGMITNSTCPIDVVNPGDGSIGNLVKMVGVEASRFTAVGQELGGKGFVLRVKGGSGCTLDPTNPNVAKVTFTGPTDASGLYFSVTPNQDGAKNVAIALRDAKGALLSSGVESADYPIAFDRPTDLRFNASYRSLTAAVTAGVASADIQFSVAVN
ncbi:MULTISPECIES: fimbrial protein [Pseudomonas]|jgi:type 1 fimbria pilin|uniref:fimbrial protein n=1 Tax=Pseudomonas TaxID=286 RepID=UPI000CFEECCF|nr:MULTISPECIES: fimbrial protein [Pseudomonas]PRA44895.1 pilus assembly protein [Pseudomonas sp. MYb115]QXN52767.1 type 1 fimbrial protein [Pseudomonas fluorescens]WSO27110.1 fimbrial protein [Pseudomonas fluorescens]